MARLWSIGLLAFVASCTGSSAHLTPDLSVVDGTANQDGAVIVPDDMVTVAPAALAFSASGYDAGTVVAGSNTTLTLTLQNNGASASGVLPILATTGDASFTVTGGTCQPGLALPGGMSCTIIVTFAPSAFGAKSGSISLSASPGGTAAASLTGTGKQTFMLTVTQAGNGSGTLTVDGTDCSAFPCVVNYVVTGSAPTAAVTETPSATSVFGGWATDCTGMATCAPVMNANRSLQGTFNLKKLTVTVNLTAVRGAAGTISAASSPTGPALSCTATACTAQYDYGTTVTLTEAPIGPALFQSWGATPCANRFATTCATGTLSADFTTTATFRPKINYMFVSSDVAVSAAGLAGSFTPADVHCDALARAAGLVNTPTTGTPYFKALLSSTATSAASRLAGAQGWIRPDGKEFANLPTDMFKTSGPNAQQIFYPPSITETGAHVDGNLAMTGTNNNGTAGPTCSDYTSTTGAILLGAPEGGSDLWLTRQSNPGCTTAWHIYCFETGQPATAVAPIPTAGARVAFVTAGTINGGAHRDPVGTAGSADALCNAERNSGGLSGTFVAMMSLTTAAASARITGTAPWMRPDGTLIANTVSDLMGWTNMVAPIDQNADGTYVTGFYSVWVGSTLPNLAASSAAVDCSDWTSTSTTGSYMIAAGSLWDGYAWFSAQACTTASHVYCLQQ